MHTSKMGRRNLATWKSVFHLMLTMVVLVKETVGALGCPGSPTPVLSNRGETRMKKNKYKLSIKQRKVLLQIRFHDLLNSFFWISILPAISQRRQPIVLPIQPRMVPCVTPPSLHPKYMLPCDTGDTQKYQKISIYLSCRILCFA